MLKMMLKRKFDAGKSGKKGFTLIEVIVVIVIIAILAAIAVPSLTRYISNAEKKQVQSMAHNIQLVLQAEKTVNYDKTFSAGNGGTIAYDTITYKDILAVNGVTLGTAPTTELTGIVWDGQVLKGFTYTGQKYNITYTNTNGFGEVAVN